MYISSVWIAWCQHSALRKRENRGSYQDKQQKDFKAMPLARSQEEMGLTGNGRV